MIWGVYNIFIGLLIFVLKINSLFSRKARLAVSGRAKIPTFPQKNKKRVLIHCASLGEYEQAKSVIHKCKEEGIEIVLTFFSPSGYEQKKNTNDVDFVCYLPFDLKNKVNDFLKAADPDLIIIVKYEFWWNFVKSDYPKYFISVVMRPDHYIFRSWAKTFKLQLKKVEAIFLIDKKSYKLLEAEGFKNIYLNGDTRGESILKRKELNLKDQVIESFCGDSKVVIFASTYLIEHEEITRIYADIQEGFKILIFPHEIDQKEIYTLKESLGKDAIIYSQWVNQPVFKGHNTLIVDKIGLLKDAYRFGSIAYIGGGFGHGIHNILEPFAYKLPLIFGPKYDKFPEAVQLAKESFVKVLSKISELKSAIVGLDSSDFVGSIQDVYESIFDSSSEASEIVMKKVKLDLWSQQE